MQSATPSKKVVTRRRTTSGSVSETNSVESTRSTNKTVASLRSIHPIVGMRIRTTEGAEGRPHERPSKLVRLVPGTEARARDGPQHLLLVVDRPAAVCLNR